MDALMAALVAALLVHAADRTAWLAARLGSRHPPLAVIAGAALAIALGSAAAAASGALLAATMSPRARDLLLALALLAAGVGAFWPQQAPRAIDRRRIAPFFAALAGVGVLALGDRMLFVTAALAARSTAPALAAVGATIGALAIVVLSVLGGERGRRDLPMIAIRLATGVVLCGAGTVQGLAALRLI